MEFEFLPRGPLEYTTTYNFNWVESTYILAYVEFESKHMPI